VVVVVVVCSVRDQDLFITNDLFEARNTRQVR
jgi:hypothetical protein